MGNKISNFFKDNVGTVLSDVGLGLVTVLDPALAPFTVTSMIGSTAAAITNQVGKEGAEAKMRATNKHVAAMLQEAKETQAVQLLDMKNGAYGGAQAGATIKMLAALQSGAPLSAAKSASGFDVAAQITDRAVRQAVKKNIGGGLGGGAADAAAHFGNAISMTSRSWGAGRVGEQAKQWLTNQQLAGYHSQMAAAARPRATPEMNSSELAAGGGSQAAAIQTGALRTNVTGTEMYGQQQ